MTINITTININFASIVDKTLLLYSSIFIHCVPINLDLKFLFHTFAKWLLYLSVELPYRCSLFPHVTLHYCLVSFHLSVEDSL